MSASGEIYSELERSLGAAPTLEAVATLSDAQRRRLRRYWLQRADGELTTALSFEHILDDLVNLNAPEALLQLARTAIADENRHVDWCLRWARLLGEDETTLPALRGTRPAVFEGASEHDNRVLRAVFGGCFSETVAVSVLMASHRVTTVESARRLGHQHLKEEMRHARLGWALLAWPGLSARDRGMIGCYVPEMVRLTRTLWQSPREPSDPALEALGFLSSELVDPASDQALSEVILPGLAHNGVLT